MFSVSLIEDHSIVRFGLVALIEKTEGFFVQETYSDGASGLKGLKSKEPDFAIIDLNLPDLSGEMIIRDLFLSDSKTKIIILSQQNYIPKISHLLSMGISAYVLKDNAAEELLEALKNVTQGKKYISPSIEELLEKMGHLKTNNDFNSLRSKLTERELEVAQMICQEIDMKKIAETLFVAPVTVRVHVKNILNKMKLRTLNDIVKLKEVLF